MSQVHQREQARFHERGAAGAMTVFEHLLQEAAIENLFADRAEQAGGDGERQVQAQQAPSLGWLQLVVAATLTNQCSRPAPYKAAPNR